MLFSSLEFLYLFLPVSVGGYFLCPRRLKNLWLFAVSLVFYAFGEPVYVLLMLFTVLCDYLFGLRLERGKRKKLILWCAVALNLALLGFFKYYDLFASLVGLPELNIPLPIGISFYTFQALSYVVDVYRGQVRAERSFVSFGAYVSLFPQLIAGPIVKYSDVSRELSDRRHSVSDAAEGIARFCVGLSKKVLLANGAGELSEAFFEKGSVLSFFVGLLLYAMQIYYDFSGYSDMAIGLGRIFGFRFPENFNYPYTSESITEFWRRWHITLSSWFREYVYIPLGGNRKGKWRTYLNLFVVWSLTGLWHGASLNFILWGVYFFVLLVIEKAFFLKCLKNIPKVLRCLYSGVFILIGWLIFAAEGVTVTELFAGISSLSFTDGGVTLYALLRILPFILIMLVGVTPLPKRLFSQLAENRPALGATLRNILSVASLLLCTAYLADAGYNPFLYFRF
ncbi:MAG: MBOAT family protein [Clostridia bacterium]|nr:MBOAT family protein [Paludibacteraceae bacterium]MBQ8850140.1 MBOAT family protein [Clostridia bacterium]